VQAPATQESERVRSHDWHALPADPHCVAEGVSHVTPLLQHPEAHDAALHTH
jgi:hypothetical protein